MPAERVVVVTAPPARHRLRHSRPGPRPPLRRRCARRARPARAPARPRAAAGRHPRGARRRPAAARTGARLRRAHLATPPRRARRACRSTSGADRPARRRSAASPTGSVGGSRRRLRPGSRENGARSSRGSCSATTQALTDGLRQTSAPSGLYHLLAVSGQNVILVAGGSCCSRGSLGHQPLDRRARRARRDRGYVLAVGAQPSVVRAGIAGSLASLAWIAGRLRDAWYALLLGRVALLAWNPYLVFDAGFQLSFAAVAAIFTLVPRSRGGSRATRCRAFVRAAVAVSTACGARDRADPVAPVRRAAAAHGAGERARRAGDPAAARRSRSSRPASASVSPPAAALVAWLNGWVAAYVALCARAIGVAPVRPDHDVPRPRGARRRRSRPPPMLGGDGRGAEAGVPVAGTDRPKVDRALQRLRGRFAADAVELHHAAEARGDDVVAAATRSASSPATDG